MERGAPKGHHKVIWTPEEWQDVAMRLLKVRPGYLHDPRPTLHAAELCEAMMGLAPERHRPAPSTSMANYRAGFVRTYAQIRAALGVEGAQISLAAPPPEAPPAPEPAPAAGPANWRSNRRVKWNSAEFLAIARYLRQRYPSAGYINSTTAAGLTMADVREGMVNALMQDRQRPLNSMSAPLRRYFAEAFKAAKMEHLRDIERAAFEEKAAAKAAKAAEQAATPVLAADDGYAHIGQLLKPLVAALAQELLMQMTPHLHLMIGNALAALPSHGPAANAPLLPQLPGRPRKKIIGVVGALPIQGNELASAFPQYEIIARPSGNTHEVVAAMRGAVRVIGMTNFMDHSMGHALKKTFGKNYVRVMGGVSAIKHQIQVWDSAGALMTEAA